MIKHRQQKGKKICDRCAKTLPVHHRLTSFDYPGERYWLCTPCISHMADRMNWLRDGGMPLGDARDQAWQEEINAGSELTTFLTEVQQLPLF